MNISSRKVRDFGIVFCIVGFLWFIFPKKEISLYLDETLKKSDPLESLHGNVQRPSTELKKHLSPTLCVLARTYEEQLPYFPVFALSLRYTGFDNIQLFVVNTDQRTNITRLQRTLHSVNEFLSHKDFAQLLDLGPIPPTNEHGYGVTDQALQYLYNQRGRNSHNCQYLLMTNGDNLFSKHLAKHVLPHMLRGVDMIGWGFVSHHQWPKLRMNVLTMMTEKVQWFDDGSQKCLMPEFRVSRIDLAAVMYRFDLLYENKMFYRIDNESYSFTADGEFVESCLKHSNTGVLLAQTLMLHQ